MNDYLWDKKGSDPEMEELERTLQEFSASNYSAVRLERETSETRRPIRDWLKLAFAVPAFAALVISALFFYGAEQEIQPVVVAADLAAPLTADAGAVTEEVPAAIPLERATKVPAQVRRRRIKRSRVRVRTKKRNPVKQPRRAAAPTIAEAAEPEFTVEEQEAYAELMRALTITSAKLRLVKDKIEGPPNTRGTK